MVTESTVVVSCTIGCGASDRLPVVIDVMTKKPRPAGPPWLCLACWMKGYRSDATGLYRLVAGRREPIAPDPAPR